MWGFSVFCFPLDYTAKKNQIRLLKSNLIFLFRMNYDEEFFTYTLLHPNEQRNKDNVVLAQPVHFLCKL